MKTIETFTLPEDRVYESEVIAARQKNNSGHTLIPEHMERLFGKAKDFKSLVYLSQVTQIEGVRWPLEHFRRNRGRCMGLVYWQLNDCWPGISWASLDYFGRWKGLHYAAARFYAPIFVSICENSSGASLHIANESKNAVSGLLEWSLQSNDGSVICRGSKETGADAFASVMTESLDFGDILTENNVKESFIYARFIVDGSVVSRATALFLSDKDYHFTDPHINLTVKEREESFELCLTSICLARYVALDLSSDDALFSDNFFDLIPGEPMHIKVEKKSLSNPLSLSEFSQQLTVQSLWDALQMEGKI